MSINTIVLGAAGAGPYTGSYWISTFVKSSGNHYGVGIGIDANGSVFCSGHGQLPSYYRPFMIGLTSDGRLLYQKNMLSSVTDGFEYATTKMVVGSSVLYTFFGGNFLSGTNLPIYALRVRADTGQLISYRNYYSQSLAGNYNYCRGGCTNPSTNYSYWGASTSNANGMTILALNSSMNMQWQQQLSGVSGQSVFGVDMAIDSSGNLYQLGYVNQSTTNYDFLIAKYNSTGTLQWQRRLSGATTNDTPNSIEVDTTGAVYICGTSGTSGLVAKYDTSGTLQWQRVISTFTASGMSLDASNNLYVTGYGGNYGYIFKYNSSGVLQWQRQLRPANGIIAFTKCFVKGTVLAVCGYTTNFMPGGTNYILMMKIPTDGSLTGTYYPYYYEASTLAESAGALTSSTSTYTNATPDYINMQPPTFSAVNSTFNQNITVIQ